MADMLLRCRRCGFSEDTSSEEIARTGGWRNRQHCGIELVAAEISGFKGVYS